MKSKKKKNKKDKDYQLGGLAGLGGTESLRLLLDNPTGLSLGTDAQGNPIPFPDELKDQLREFLDQSDASNGGLSVQNDINAFRVDPSRGFFQEGGDVSVQEGIGPLALMAAIAPQFQRQYPTALPGMNITPNPISSLLPANIHQFKKGGKAKKGKKKKDYQQGGNVNTTGFTPGTASFNNAFNIIPSGNITTQNTPFPLFAQDNLGNSAILPPGGDFQFPGSQVTEIPLAQLGGTAQQSEQRIPVFADYVSGKGKGQPQLTPEQIQMLQQLLIQNQEADIADANVLQRAGLGQAQFGGRVSNFFNSVGRGIGQGARGVADFALTSAFGADDLIQNSFVDNSRFLNAANNVFGGITRTAANIALPGSGSALSAIGSGLNSLNPRDTAPSVQPETAQQAGFQNNQAQFNPTQLLQMLSLLGGNQGSTQTSPLNRQLGGYVNQPEGLIPIQAEIQNGIPEQIIHLDATITDVNAKTSHKKMDDDEVTDLVYEGSYIASSDKSMMLSKKDAEEYLIGVETLPYSEHKNGKIPIDVLLSDIFKDDKKLLPSELAKRIKKKFAVVEDDDLCDDLELDIFEKNTNQENLISRTPWLSSLIDMSETLKEKRGEKDDVQSFGKGGFLNKKKEYQIGGLVENIGPILDLLRGAGTAIGGIVNNNRSNRGTATNLAARQDSLQQSLNFLNGNLLPSLRNNNNSSLQVGAASILGQDPRVDAADFGAARQALQNGRNRSLITTRQSERAAATPRLNTAALAAQLGQRGASNIINNQSSQTLAAINSAATQRLQNNSRVEQNFASQLANLNIRDAQSQTSAANSTRANQNNQLRTLGAQGLNFLQRDNNINQFGFNQTNDINNNIAQLQGLADISRARNGNNLLGTLGSLNIQDSIAELLGNVLGGQSGAATANPGIGLSTGTTNLSTISNGANIIPGVSGGTLNIEDLINQSLGGGLNADGILGSGNFGFNNPF